MVIVSDPELSWAVNKALFIVASGFVAVMYLVWIAFKNVVFSQTNERETMVYQQAVGSTNRNKPSSLEKSHNPQASHVRHSF